MSKISEILKKVILWLLASGRMEFLIELARRVVSRLEHRDDLDSEAKREQAREEIKKKIRETGRQFTNHMINLAIELALTEFRNEDDDTTKEDSQNPNG